MLSCPLVCLVDGEEMASNGGYQNYDGRRDGDKLAAVQEITDEKNDGEDNEVNKDESGSKFSRLSQISNSSNDVCIYFIPFVTNLAMFEHLFVTIFCNKVIGYFWNGRFGMA